jgi:pSer/pThr/pTyr-binding forkhead associated (FHA) protein
MEQNPNEATRVMGAGGTPEDRTTVAGAPPAAPQDRTMVAGAPPMAGATQMGATITCPICRTTNSGLETYCGECGFLLASTPGAALAESEPEGPVTELVDAASGRRFRLKPGVNTIGRENCDILIMDGTVSRRHAQIALENGLVILQDLGSSNGTSVDGNRLGPNQPMPIAPGTVIKFGNAMLTLIGPPSQAEATIIAPQPGTSVEVDTPPDALTEQTLLAPSGTDNEGAAGETPTAASAQPPTPAAAAADISSAELIAKLRPSTEGAEEILLLLGTTSIGRRTGNTVVISDDPYISGRHAEVHCDHSGCYLVDVGSTNGTLVNGQRLEVNVRQLLLDGDEVNLGQSSYLFETVEGSAEEQESPEAEPQPESAAETTSDAGSAAEEKQEVAEDDSPTSS